ncbi:MAG: HD family phosphohydrolase [Desulfuromonas sp.]|nr:MAG: HD family phosphohydrolase [Desulfuromonas sp.]
MKDIYVENIRERDWVESVFLVREKITATAKNGKPYLTLKLMDRSGEVEGRVWDNVEALSATFDRDDFVQVSAKASVYLGKMQLVVQKLVRLDEKLVDLRDFLPVATRSLDGMIVEFRELIASLANPHLRALMEAFLEDQDFMQAFCRAPAAKSMHHVYLGGLLDHSLSVAQLAHDVSSHYPEVDRDLLVVGALLHDIGKVAELRYSRSFEYTDAGKLLGHIVMGVELVEEKIRELNDFPTLTGTLLKHLLLSHHGQYEYGSPKRPKTLEAVVLNFIDDLDSKINGISSYLQKENTEYGQWTGYHRLYERYFYRPAGQGDKAESRPGRVEVSTTAEGVASRSSAPPQQKPQAKPLSHSLADQLKGKSLDLFAAEPDEKEKS